MLNTGVMTDWQFACQNPDEFRSKNGGTLAPMIRYVASLNPDCAKKDFIETLAALGVNKTTAAIQFTASRQFDVANYGGAVSEDGRYLVDA